MIPERPLGPYLISADPARLDLDAVHAFLSRAYWARDRSRARLERAVAGSIPFGAYLGDVQVGFCRVVTDRAVTAHLLDVFVDEAHRRRGLGRALTLAALSHPDLTDCGWTLFTSDAHGVYAALGFERPEGDAGLMRRPSVAARPLSA